MCRLGQASGVITVLTVKLEAAKPAPSVDPQPICSHSIKAHPANENMFLSIRLDL